jgi:hypothetical protein
MRQRHEPDWISISAELARQSAKLRAASDEILRRAHERRQMATKLLREMREMFGMRPYNRQGRRDGSVRD